MSARALAAAFRDARRVPDALVVRLQGELGNQLFQYATGLALSRQLGCALRFDVEHDAPTVAHCVGDRLRLASPAELVRVAERRGDGVDLAWRTLQFRLWLPYRRARALAPRHRRLSDSFAPPTPIEAVPVFVRGYFQHLGWFAPVLDEVVAQVVGELDLVGPPDGPGAPGGLEAGEPVVGVHVRRGDYLPRGWELDLGYYEKAFDLLDAELGRPRLRVFADDRAFAELLVEHLIGRGRLAELAPEGPVRVHPAVDALVDLARCPHVVIANSTFSWWAAALGDRLARHRQGRGDPGRERIVIAPLRWRRDRPPPELALDSWRTLDW